MPSSIFDVAHRAGVSIATVSRVLNKTNHRVRQSTRERVLRAAADLGYTPSPLARALVTRQTRIVGVLIGDVIDTYYTSIVQGAEAVAHSNDYLLITCNTRREPEVVLSYLRLLGDYQAAGVLFGGGALIDPVYLPALHTMVDTLREQGTHFVSLGQPSQALPEVNIDNVAAISEMVDHLVKLGHRRIAFIDGTPNVTTCEQRLEGYRSGLSAHGLPFDPALVLPGNFTFEGGQRAADSLCRLEPRPTAVMAISDETAIGCLTALRERGISVPGEVSVTGCNDLITARYVEPPLTTITVPLHDFGATGMVQLLRLLNGEEIEPFYLLPHHLVIRRSTAPPAPDAR
jgi:LacI family transcriptional regulator